MMLPRHGQEQGLTSHKKSGAEVPYERLAPKGRLPTAVDWRGTGADNVVKDQATCGSCWAFGATAALQSAYWMATGAPLAPCTGLEDSLVCLWLCKAPTGWPLVCPSHSALIQEICLRCLDKVSSTCWSHGCTSCVIGPDSCCGQQQLSITFTLQHILVCQKRGGSL